MSINVNQISDGTIFEDRFKRSPKMALVKVGPRKFEAYSNEEWEKAEPASWTVTFFGTDAMITNRQTREVIRVKPVFCGDAYSKWNKWEKIDKRRERRIHRELCAIRKQIEEQAMHDWYERQVLGIGAEEEIIQVRRSKKSLARALGL